MRLSQDGRWGFVVNPAERSLHVFDAAGNALVHTLPMDGSPTRSAFSRAFAYVRLLDSPQVKMVNLQSLGAGRNPIVQGFGAGTLAPAEAGELSDRRRRGPGQHRGGGLRRQPGRREHLLLHGGHERPHGQLRRLRPPRRGRHGRRPEPEGGRAGNVRRQGPHPGGRRATTSPSSSTTRACSTASPRRCSPTRRCRRGAARWWPSSSTSRPGRPPARRSRSGSASPTPSTRAPRDGVRDVKVLYHSVPGGPKVEAAARGKGAGSTRPRPSWTAPAPGTSSPSIPSLQVKPGDVPYRGLVVDSPQGKRHEPIPPHPPRRRSRPSPSRSPRPRRGRPAPVPHATEVDRRREGPARSPRPAWRCPTWSSSTRTGSRCGCASSSPATRRSWPTSSSRPARPSARCSPASSRACRTGSATTWARTSSWCR